MDFYNFFLLFHKTRAFALNKIKMFGKIEFQSLLKLLQILNMTQCVAFNII